MDYFLKADGEIQLTDDLVAAGIMTHDGEITPGYALDVIGIIHKPTGEMLTGEDGPYPEMAPIDGYHANVRGELSAEQQAKLPLIDVPNAPVRVWA